MPGFDDGFGTSATFNGPEGVAYDLMTRILYVVDGNSNIIRRILSTGMVNHVLLLTFCLLVIK